MNQILITENNNYIYKDIVHPKKIKLKRYLFILFFSIIICIIIVFYLISSYFFRIKEKNQTSIVKNKYNISTLYSNTNNNYNTLKLSNEVSIIGLIEIPKINISYPILENSNEGLLKISVCRFSGPYPNTIGNLCIAGHNYKNSLMFGNLYKLDINDSIYITDLKNTKLEYIVYDKFKVKENNLECIKNKDNIEITLITCNDNNNSERIVIKAKVKG